MNYIQGVNVYQKYLMLSHFRKITAVDKAETDLSNKEAASKNEEAKGNKVNGSTSTGTVDSQQKPPASESSPCKYCNWCGNQIYCILKTRISFISTLQSQITYWFQTIDNILGWKRWMTLKNMGKVFAK